jgi:hypothetical protein
VYKTPPTTAIPAIAKNANSASTIFNPDPDFAGAAAIIGGTAWGAGAALAAACCRAPQFGQNATPAF